MKSTVIFLFICYSFTISAELYNGKIISKGNQTPVKYANIGIPNKNTGTTSDASGNFSINLPT